MSEICILANQDGEEAENSIQSAKTVQSVLNCEIVYLSSKNWERSLNYLGGKICFLCTHGGYGEDGRLQHALQERRLEHTHSRGNVAKILANKHQTKCHYSLLEIPTPPWVFNGDTYGNLNEGKNNIVVIKPVEGGSKNGIYFDQGNQKNISCEFYERYIDGHLEISVPVLGTAKPIALPALVRDRFMAPFGVVNSKNTRFVDEDILQQCEQWALKTHSSLEARGVSKTDFVLDEEGNIFAIETDAHPGLGINQATAMQALQAGISYKNLILEIVNSHAE